MSKKIIHRVFEYQAAQYPGRIAVEKAGRQVSYEQLNTCANQIAYLLRELGIGREDIAGVMMPPGIELVTALLGIFKSGGVYLPMDVSFPARRLEHMIRQTELPVLITTQAWQETVEQRLRELDSQPACLLVLHETYGHYTRVDWDSQQCRKRELNMQEYFQNPLVINQEDDGNYLFYTSGSTGEAKAFLGCHKSLSHFIHWELKEFALDETCRVSQLAPLTFDASLRDIFVPLCSGGTLCIPDSATKTTLPKLVEWLHTSRVNLVHCVPSLFRLLTKELAAGGQPVTFPYLKYILLAGEPLYSKDIQAWRQVAGAGTELVNLYGTSETTLAKTFHRIGTLPEEGNKALPVGKPIANAAVAIIHQGHLCETGKIGEVYIKTPFMTKGYYKDETLNRARFVPNPLVTDRVEILHKTGDLGRYLADGNIEILGRLDEQVKVNGIRVELGEIRQAALGLEGVRETVVLAHKNSTQENELVCYYTGPEVEEATLQAYLQRELPAGIVPAYVIRMNEFPLTINGKVDKKALPKPEQLIMQDADYQEVRGETERQLEQIYQEILGLSRIGRKVSFFKIGGTSLKAMQVASRIYKTFNVSVKIADVFAHSSVGQLAGVVEAARATAYQEIPRVAAQAYYDVSQAQKRLWIQDQFEEQRVAYHMNGAVTLKGNLNLEAFTEAFTALVERHESLRTRFTVVDGEPKQRIIAPGEDNFTMSCLDVRPEPDQTTVIQELIRQETFRPFDLEAEPLLRAWLIQTSNNQYIFLCTMHHIISDGWSMEVIVRDVLSLYTANTEGKLPDLPPLRIGYKDYAAWHNRQLENSALLPHRQYWLGQLSGDLPVLSFPTDQPRPLVKSTNGAVLAFQIPPLLTAGLQALSRQHGASLFMTLLGCVYTLLHRYTGQQDLIIGSPIAGRDHPDLEDQVGLFVNMLALRARLQGTDRFADVLEQVKQVTVAAYEHKAYPFDQLIKDLSPEFDPRRSPLTDVWVQLSDRMVGSDISGPVTVRPYELGFQTSKVDLTFKFTLSESQIVTLIEYNTDLFKERTIEKVRDNLLHLVQLVQDDPQLLIAHADLLTSAEETEEQDSFLKALLG